MKSRLPIGWLLFAAAWGACSTSEKDFYTACDAAPPQSADIPDLPLDAAEDMSGDAAYNALCTAQGGSALFDNRFAPFLGGETRVDAVVEVAAFFGCPHCRDFAAYAQDLWDRDADIRERVRLYFHHYPFTGWEFLHTAAVAAQAQGAFWPMHDFLFALTAHTFTTQDIRDFAASLGLDMELFDTHWDEATPQGAAIAALVALDRSRARALCADYTPAVYVCGRLLTHWQDLDDALHDLLQ